MSGIFKLIESSLTKSDQVLRALACVDIATHHHAQVQTYDVVPMSESLGAVAFVPDTIPLMAQLSQPNLIPIEVCQMSNLHLLLASKFL